MFKFLYFNIFFFLYQKENQFFLIFEILTFEDLIFILSMYVYVCLG